jgi:endonuclease III
VQIVILFWITFVDDNRSRGKFRPRLKQLISSNPAAEVKSTTQHAFKEIGDDTTTASIIKAVKMLSELKGVGPATATMMLQTASDDVPFMSDEAMLQVFNGDKTKLKYDVKTCEAFTNEINKLVNGLNAGEDVSGYSG